MTDARQYVGFGDVEKILVKSYKSITGGREFDIDKYGPYIDAVRCFLVPSLEKQIIFFLERFVYNEDFQQSSCQRYLDRYKESMLTACAKYNEIGTSMEAMRDSLTIDHIVDFLGHSLLTNSRLAKISDDLNAMGIEKNWLGYMNVLNYINEKDFWVSSSSSSNSSRQYSSICSLTISNNNIHNDMNVERCSNVVEQTARGHKRPRKRAATHISRKHYKLERLAQMSDKSFRVSESVYKLLKSNWDLNDSLHTKRRLKRNCGDLRRSSFAKHRQNRRKTDWKNENLTLIIRKMNGSGGESIDNEYRRNSEVKTSSSLPCRVDQLLRKLARADPCLTKFHCSFIEKKFHTKLYNVCSCLNNLLSRIDVRMINTIHLICEIRKDYLKFRLKQTRHSKCDSTLFSARVMTCEALYRYGIRKSTSRQKLKSQSFWAMKKADELSTGLELSNVCQGEDKNFYNDRAISSIEISFTGCEGSVGDQQNVGKGLTCDPQDLEGLVLGDSLSISDVVQKLEMSPFRLQETEQSFRIRSKIQDIVRSIMICTQEHSVQDRVGEESISIHAIVSTSSLQAIKNGKGVLPIESKSSEELSLSKMVSFIESEICPSRSEEILDCEECVTSDKSAESRKCGELTGSPKSKKSPMPKSCLMAKEKNLISKGSVRPDKSLKKSRTSSSSGRSAELRNKNKCKICRTSAKPVMSKEFTGRHRRPLSKKMVESIASQISNALARNKSNGGRVNENGKDYDIDVTVEIEESSQSSDDFTESISRHTHLLPSMKSVRLGTSSRYVQRYCENSTSSSSSSGSKVSMHDNYTTMNKSMISGSNRGTISAKSYNRMKHLIRGKVCKKLSDTDSSCQPNSSKTIVSSGKYYLSIPSSKANRVRLKREISESSSTSSNNLELPIFPLAQGTPRTLSSEDESLSVKSSGYDFENSTQSSRAATFDKNSVYGCIEDRLANRYFRDIVNDYSDGTGNSPRPEDAKSQISNEGFPGLDDCGFHSDEREIRTRRYDHSEDSTEENETGLSRGFASDDDACTNISWTNGGIENSYQCHPEEKFLTKYIVGRGENIVQGTPRPDEYERVEKIKGIRRATGWSTCAIRSSSVSNCSEVYPPKSNCRMNVRNRGDSQQNTFAFDPLNIIETYKKRFRNIDKSLRSKLTQYIGFCKNVRSRFQKQVCLDDIYEGSRTSIGPSSLKRHKYNDVYFGG